jgi:hypothetical protein
MNDATHNYFKKKSKYEANSATYLQLDKVHSEELARVNQRPPAAAPHPSIHWKPFYDSVVDEP